MLELASETAQGMSFEYQKARELTLRIINPKVVY
jgi:hypothetical protein